LIKLDINAPRTRKVVRRTTHRVVGRSPSLKVGRMIHWESQIERDMIKLLEFDPAVLRYAEQPTPMKYLKDGKQRQYTPDFLVETRSGLSVIEVKPAAHLTKEPFCSLLPVIREYYDGQNIPFSVMTDVEIRREPRLANISLILRYQRQNVSLLKIHNVLDLLMLRPCAADELLDQLRPTGLTFFDLCALIAKGLLWTDIDQKFDAKSVLYRPDGG